MPPAECFPAFATDPVVEFGISGANQTAWRRGSSQLRARPWVGQAKTAGPDCRSASARPVRGEPKEGGAVGCPAPNLYGCHPRPVNGCELSYFSHRLPTVTILLPRTEFRLAGSIWLSIQSYGRGAGCTPAAFASSRRMGAPSLHEWVAIDEAASRTNRISSRFAPVSSAARCGCGGACQFRSPGLRRLAVLLIYGLKRKRRT
jgi:hypothetical protein